MPPNGEVSSLTAIGGRQYGPAAFTTTHWSVVLEAQGESPSAQEALEKALSHVLATYLWVRAATGCPEPKMRRISLRVSSLLLLERKDLHTVRKEKGRLRCYLLTSVKNFLADEARQTMAVKRGKKDNGLIPLDEIP